MLPEARSIQERKTKNKSFFSLAIFQRAFQDADNDSMTDVRIESLPGNGRLLLDDVPVIADGDIRHSGDVPKAIAVGAGSDVPIFVDDAIASRRPHTACVLLTQC